MQAGELVVRGRYPWNNRFEKPKTTIVFGQDSKQEINKCLACRNAECNNCLCQDKTALAIEKCESLLQQQKTEQQICALMNISRATFYRYKKTALAF